MLLGTGLVVTIMYIVVNLPQDNIVYEREEVEVTKEVTPDWASDEEAVKAAQAVIRKKELQAELATVNEEIKAKQTRKTEIEKELGTYWRDKENVKRLIRETFPEDPRTAVAVAECESNLDPKAYNPNNTNGTTDGGLWQINSSHDKRLQELGLDKNNPEDATKFARMLYDERGWNPWVCHSHGMLVMR